MEYIAAKTVVSNYAENPDWFGTNYNMNIYKGCCHGCIYCDSRSSCYRIDDFDKVRAKENALTLIRNDLRRKIKKGIVATGAMSDPYNPFEKGLKLTRNALQLIDAFGFGVAIATKGTLITRDIDILNDIKSHSPVLCKLTITTTDDALCSKIEPNAPTSSERFEAIKELSDNGIYTGVLLMPVLPFITDNEKNIINIVRRSYESGARFIYASFGVTLRENQRMHYFSKLDDLFPGLTEKYIKQYGTRYGCTSKEAKSLWNAFENECQRLGLLYRMQDIIKSYKLGYTQKQISIFDDILF